LVLEPIEPFVAGTEELVVVPGELLAAVPFEALVDANEKFVIESRRVRYVSGATELVELANAARPRTADLSSAVVVAAPDYSSGPGLALDSGHRVHFNALPGAAAEGEAVARRLGSSENLVSGRRATTSFLLELQGPPVLHIASHSFFLTSGSTPAAMAEMLRVASASRKSEPGTYELEVSEPAMVRAGVVLAGANGGATIHAGGQAYDGILTALNFAGVDLRETQLVVLSACETGVGHATLGEGLDGMRTALRIAGARTRVLSLWEVDDCATRQFMEEWYRRMVAGEDRIDALRSVKLDMLRGLLQPTAECAVQSAALTSTGDRKQGWSHPNFWAPFVAEGASGRL
jgi:CHAT domain-containing protein